VLTTLALLSSFAFVPVQGTDLGPEITDLGGDTAPGIDPADELLIPPAPREHSKKEQWLLEKAARHDVRVDDRDMQRAPFRLRAAPATSANYRPGATLHPIATLYNVWTHEALPLVPGQSVEDRFHPFLRDHFTNQATRMDVRLIDVLEQVARRFRADRIEVVSGYRSPKYNLMLRKKGHQVARTSQHMEGHAVDFRIRGVPTTVLLRYVRSLHRGGVGFYPHSQFVHSDTGPIRFWKGS
jgi:hypothetical protein